MRRTPLAVALMMVGFAPAVDVQAIKAIKQSVTYEAPSIAGYPRHTPKISDRPQRGWRTVQRKARWSKLNARIRANRRSL